MQYKSKFRPEFTQERVARGAVSLMRAHLGGVYGSCDVAIASGSNPSYFGQNAFDYSGRKELIDLMIHASKAKVLAGERAAETFRAPSNIHLAGLEFNFIGRADDMGVRSFNCVARRGNGDVVYCGNFGGAHAPWPNSQFDNLLVVRNKGWISTYNSPQLNGPEVGRMLRREGDMHNLFWEFLLKQNPESVGGGSADFSPIHGNIIHKQSLFRVNTGELDTKHLAIGESRVPFDSEAMPGRQNAIFHDFELLHDFGYYDCFLARLQQQFNTVAVPN
jgi:hypothetical protein